MIAKGTLKKKKNWTQGKKKSNMPRQLNYNSNSQHYIHNKYMYVCIHIHSKMLVKLF